MTALRMSAADGLDIESTIHAEAMRRSADDDDSSDDVDDDSMRMAQMNTKVEADIDGEDDPYPDNEWCYGAEGSGISDRDVDGDEESEPKNQEAHTLTMFSCLLI